MMEYRKVQFINVPWTFITHPHMKKESNIVKKQIMILYDEQQLISFHERSIIKNKPIFFIVLFYFLFYFVFSTQSNK